MALGTYHTILATLNFDRENPVTVTAPYNERKIFAIFFSCYKLNGFAKGTWNFS